MEPEKDAPEAQELPKLVIEAQPDGNLSIIGTPNNLRLMLRMLHEATDLLTVQLAVNLMRNVRPQIEKPTPGILRGLGL